MAVLHLEGKKGGDIDGRVPRHGVLSKANKQQVGRVTKCNDGRMEDWR